MRRTKNGRAPFWVIVKDTYGHDEVVYRTTTEDDARCFMTPRPVWAAPVWHRMWDFLIGHTRPPRRS